MARVTPRRFHITFQLSTPPKSVTPNKTEVTVMMDREDAIELRDKLNRFLRPRRFLWWRW